MVGGIVARDELKRVPGEGISAVVINGLDGRKGEETGALEQRHARHLESDASTKGVEKEALNRVVVKGTIGIRDVETVVSGVESCYKEKMVNGLFANKTVESDLLYNQRLTCISR